MAYFGVYIPPSKAGFEGTLAQCAGSIAAVNINVLPESVASGADDTNASKYEDPEYPPDSPLWLIFTEKSKALEVLRHYKEARLREFPNRDQAESYVQFGFESIESLKRYGKAKPASKPVSLPRMLASGPKAPVFGTTPDGIGPYSLTATDRILSPFAPLSLANMVLSMPDSSANNTDGTASGSSASSNISLSAERPPFRAPSKQELVEFRKQIEAGNYERVKRVVWDNPRFLISSGDTPTSLKEGYRYNAMHICAQCNQARVAELILKTISERDFTQMYAGKKSSAEMCAALSENLLDYYLNMPDKGRGETPLHFAVKNGHVDVVEVLTSYPQCKSLKNTEGMQPKDIICQRAQNASPEVFKKLELLLSEPHYVPVLRSVGNELPPQVGQPFTPNDPPTLHHKCDDSGKIGMKLKISALAGPMPREQAYSFFRRWKTPPRFGGNGLPLSSSPYISPIKRPNKSLINKSVNGRRVLFSPNSNHGKSEQNADDLQPIENNNNNNCTYKEGSNGTHRLLELPSSPLRQMNSLDVSSEFSLNVSAVSAMNNSFRERHIKNSDIEKGLEMIGRQLAHQEDLEWREYWDFLDDFVDISSNNGIARLESYLAGKSDQAQASLLAEKTDQAWNFSQMHQYLDLVADRGKTNVNASTAGIAITQVMTPYTCVEKSLQVFAKRITKTLINNIGNMVSINDTLLSELKRLKSLIVSFKDDARFITVDFTKVHSRIAHLVASYIAHSQEVSTALRYQLMQMLRKLLQLTGDRREHLQCVCGSMLPMLDQVPVVQLPDALKTEELCSSAWDMEQCCKCLWDANLSRKTSRRKRTESLRAQAQELGNAASTSAAAAATLAADAAAQCNPDPSNDSFVTVFGNCSITDNNNVDDDRDDDSFFYDCGDDANDDNSSDDEAIFMTPPESRSPRISCSETEPRYELFIFGKEPTKRDLDVLNAIFNVEVDKETHPFVFAWRAAMESFTTEEMDLFPSPTNIQKSNKSSFFNITRTPNAMQTNSPSSNSSIPDNSSITHVKKLIATPKLNAAAMFRHLGITSTPPKLPWPSTPPRAAGTPQNGVKKQETSTPIDTPSPASPFPTVAVTSDHQTVIVSSVTQTFQTPLDKMRGLFTKYREIRREDSPTAFSPKSLSGRLNLSISLDESD